MSKVRRDGNPGGVPRLGDYCRDLRLSSGTTGSARRATADRLPKLRPLLAGIGTYRAASAQGGVRRIHERAGPGAGDGPVEGLPPPPPPFAPSRAGRTSPRSGSASHTDIWARTCRSRVLPTGTARTPTPRPSASPSRTRSQGETRETRETRNSHLFPDPGRLRSLALSSRLPSSSMT